MPLETPPWPSTAPVSCPVECGGSARFAHRLFALGFACDSTAPMGFASLGIYHFIMTAGGKFSLTAETHVEQEEGQNECEERGWLLLVFR